MVLKIAVIYFVSKDTSSIKGFKREESLKDPSLPQTIFHSRKV